MQEHRRLIQFVNDTEEAQLVLATLINTQGSSYKKAGARKVIAMDGSSSGLISGGCLEGEIVDVALKMRGKKEIHNFDTTAEEDRLFGYGLGCQGVLTIEFQKLDRETLLNHLKDWNINDQLWVHIVGGGPDIEPLNGLIDQMGWHLRNYNSKKDLLENGLDVINHDRSAVLLMSHSYETDLNVLSQLADQPTAYIGVLGPEKRKNQMLEDLKTIHNKKFPQEHLDKIHGPMGFDGFDRGEHAVALSVVAELQHLFFGVKN